MLHTITNNKLLFIAIHIVIGFLATFSFFTSIYAISVLVIGLLIVILSNNEKEEAMMMSGYVVGVEVFLRMIRSGISYELGKYGVIIFLLIGIFFGETKQKPNILFIFYIFLLLIGILFTQAPEGESIRNSIIFNLLGPILLGVASFYFYQRRITKEELLELFYFILLPIFSMVTFMYFRTPDLSEIAFGGVSLGATSGGFGPNQVATILGFGVFIIAVFVFLRVKMTGYIILDAIFLIYFTYRGLLTFSRGGIISAAFAILVFFIFMLFYQKKPFQSIFKYILISSFFIIGVWLYTSNVTNGMIDNRYAGKNASGVVKKDVSAGRGDIINNQIENFYNAPIFGIGVGNGKFERELSMEKITAASHNEVSRLLEEHGLIGLLILIILLIPPLKHFRYSNNYQRAFLISFYVFWFLTINHSAMRVAFPGFVYGLCLINLVDEHEND